MMDERSETHEGTSETAGITTPADVAALQASVEANAAALAALHEKVDRMLVALERLDAGQNTVVMRLNQLHQRRSFDVTRRSG